jgi:hypothetical protein
MIYFVYHIIMLDWGNVDIEIKNIKYPLVFLITIIRNQNLFDDYNLSILIRFYIKNNLNLCYNLPIFLLIDSLDSKFKITKQVVNEFYNCILNRINNIVSIIEFKNVCKDQIWYCKEENVITQKNKIEEIFEFFKSHFDAAKTGLTGVTKYIGYIKSSFTIYENNNPIIYELKDRLNRLNLFFGTDIFKNQGILIISNDDFDKISIPNKLKYILYFYLKVEKLFIKIINVYDSLIIDNNKINSILSPKPINIIVSETSNINLDDVIDKFYL